MNKKIFNIIYVCIFACALFAMSVFTWIKPETEFSETEKRYLAQKPELTFQTLFSGEFMKSFEEYSTDQFPLRENFRTLKAVFSTNILSKLENNQLYTQNGHISKIEYPENPNMVNYVIDKLNYINEKYLLNSGSNLYFSIVPDKHYFLAAEKGYPTIDYTAFIEKFKNALPYINYVDIIPFLEQDDYYYTDSHWKQENITDIAEFLSAEMDADFNASYSLNIIDYPFMGVYAGQSALPTNGDTLKYLTNDTIANFKITYYDTGMPVDGILYDIEKSTSKDPYEMFLSGTSPLLTIENPNTSNDKELILFRDSFGSSIAPLLAQGYKKITVIDIRYIQTDFLGNFVDFSNKDVLFLYSTTLLNNSSALR